MKRVELHVLKYRPKPNIRQHGKNVKIKNAKRTPMSYTRSTMCDETKRRVFRTDSWCWDFPATSPLPFLDVSGNSLSPPSQP